MDPDSSNIFYSLFIWLLLTLLSALFSAGESAVVALNDGKLHRMADEGDKRAKTLVRLTSSPVRFLSTTQTGSVLSGLMAIAIVADQFTRLTMQSLESLALTGGLSRPIFALLASLLLAFLILVLGHLLPRRLASYFPDKVAFGLAPILDLFSKILFPLVFLATATTNGLLRLFRQNPHATLGQVTEEEIRMMVDAGEEKGAIEQSEKDMINNIFEFDDRTVDEIMTHRMETVAVSERASLEEIVAAAQESGYSRIPVYAEDIDDILGILYVKDLLSLIGDPEKEQAFDIRNYLREPFYIPETARCTELFKNFKTKKLHMAVVVDEYGGTYGIVTMEDLLESIVGNIQDEYDKENTECVQLDETTWMLDGWMSVDEVEHLLNFAIPDDVEYETIGGVLVDMLGDIPPKGEHPVVSIGNVQFTIMEVNDRRISQVKACVLPLESSR